MSKKYLYLICNPNKWFSNEDNNYKFNEVFKALSNHSWSVGKLKDIHQGMHGIIKVSQDTRSKGLLSQHNILALESGIYATFKVVSFDLHASGNKIEIKVIDNFFARNRQISKKSSQEILGEKFNSRGPGYIDESIYNAVCKAIQDTVRKSKQLTVEKSKEVYPRDEKEKQEALKFAGYKCEFDSQHVTFISRLTSQNYVEGHHLIPICASDKFRYDIDVRENIVSLCPTCHRKLHSGVKEDVDSILEYLYNKRKDMLKNAKLNITLKKLKKIYSEMI